MYCMRAPQSTITYINTDNTLSDTLHLSTHTNKQKHRDSLRRTKNSEALLQACISQAGNTTFYRGAYCCFFPFHLWSYVYGRWEPAMGEPCMVRRQLPYTYTYTHVVQTTTTNTAGRVSDAFRSAHGLLVVHVWMLHKRLLMEASMCV